MCFENFRDLTSDSSATACDPLRDEAPLCNVCDSSHCRFEFGQHPVSLVVCSVQVRNPDSDAETKFKSGKRNFDLVFGHPDRMYRRSDFLENRSGHFGQNVQHRSCCGILCWCADLHDLYAVWYTDRRCFYPRVSVLYQEENGLQKVSDLFIRVGRATFL